MGIHLLTVLRLRRLYLPNWQNLELTMQRQLRIVPILLPGIQMRLLLLLRSLHLLKNHPPWRLNLHMI
ncbi:hypothetical protein B7L32_03625 [Serratia marcescens]|nr:hypothetical protein B7L32_03625 [Serratia marcescens]